MKLKHVLTTLVGIVFLTNFSIANAASQKHCKRYADRALVQYKIYKANKKCKLPPDDTWRRNFARHYDWCLIQRSQDSDTQENLRDAHLYSCGGLVKG
jgi:hypothetical protein